MLAHNTTRVEREPDYAKQTQKRVLCRLTLELSGARLFARPLGRLVRAHYEPPNHPKHNC